MSDDVGSPEQQSDMVQFSLDVCEIDTIKRYIANDAPYWSRLSLAFCLRLANLEKVYGEARDVFDEIDSLEGLRPPGITKAATIFKRGALKGLWHKHFYSSRHIIRNFGERWNLGRNGNADLNNMITEAMKDCGEQPSIWPGAIAHRIVIGGLEDRSAARRMTGDWIIFAKNSVGENIYLDLATHEEGRRADVLLEKLRMGNAGEFPELFNN
ncbi:MULTISPECIES: hypothetical protein [Bosea]|uniref:hypothetical protein n=1 Tax=Bosea TaxID=85413 RepID=UPI00214F7ADB|nr:MULTISPECIES: hypothetical protein [Bosea]MCR4523384.1 hypothetical protein [Bosea sp. 47.2.35]MDR6828543.1 hypothetical protein [Bosea robiniae]MDR6895202.1 hypothetical protein [Bosea sp. BE109]MDR7138598.1 hypothetical protein [Bosea sp. BE168]MDR7175427.1 hypothetical protein [Bosea sp. BE271]